MKAKARVIQGSVRAVAYTVPKGIRPMAMPTDKTGIMRFLNVAPEEPQQLVWIVPQYGIDYTVTTSSGLEWKIK